MHMKWFGSESLRLLLLGTICMCGVVCVSAQQLPEETTYLPPWQREVGAAGCLADSALSETEASGEEVMKRYERHAYRARYFWNKLIPQYVKMQYAGSIGLFSIGTGWDYGKHNRWETEMLFGFLPKYEDESAKITFTLRQSFIPWTLPIRNTHWSIEPLTCGLFVNTVFDNRFWMHEPGRYPNGYYNFSTKMRFHIFLGQQITFDLSRIHRAYHRAISFYYQISTCDLYVASAWNNGYLHPSDYLSLAFGIKFRLLD